MAQRANTVSVCCPCGYNTCAHVIQQKDTFHSCSNSFHLLKKLLQGLKYWVTLETYLVTGNLLDYCKLTALLKSYLVC